MRHCSKLWFSAMVGALMAVPVSPQISAGRSTSNELCLTANCSKPAHICGLVPAESWLSLYVDSFSKVCRCDNVTFAGPNCQTVCPGGHRSPCNNHGECIYGDASCVCDAGWKGTSCTAECPKTFGQVCAAKGECVQVGDNGAACNCFPGFRGGNCTIECKGGAARPCSNRGICEADGSCTCLGGWRGEDCSTECPGGNLFPCNLNGKCTRDALCECEPMFRGPACEFKCPTVFGVPCGGRGTCNSSGLCSCEQGYRGDDCMLECAGGLQNPCSGHGTCKNDSTCECSIGWAGLACEESCPGGLEMPCSGHGICTTEGGTASCVCDSLDQINQSQAVLLRYEGPACETPIYNPQKRVTNISAREALFTQPETWVAALPPGAVLVAFLSVVITRLYIAYTKAKAEAIAELNQEINQQSTLVQS